MLTRRQFCGRGVGIGAAAMTGIVRDIAKSRARAVEVKSADVTEGDSIPARAAARPPGAGG